MTQLQEFILVFGQRFIGLVDNASVYSIYRVPIPEAPYPQDYIIDQQGNVAYWSDQYDPQEIIRVIDSLLGTQVEESEMQDPGSRIMELDIMPNPITSEVRIAYCVGRIGKYPGISIYDASGRLVRTYIVHSSYFLVPGEIIWDLNDQEGQRVPSGVYYIKLSVGEKSVTKSCIVTR